MTLVLGLRAIPPSGRRRRFDPQRMVTQVDQQLVRFIGEANRDLATYPPIQPWAHGYPKSGPRKGGRRTGTYGRNWRIMRHQTGKSILLANPTSYGWYVGGPLRGPKGRRQARFQTRRGWASVTTAGSRLWPPYAGRITRIIQRGGS